MLSMLVTGFGPFLGVALNPSAILARQVAHDIAIRASNIRARHLVLATSYSALAHQLVPTLALEAPECVLMLGVAARRTRICIESRAANRASVMAPDADGQPARRFALHAGAEPARRPRFPLQPLLRAIAGPGVRPVLSRDAGRYLCNAAYYEALGMMDGRPVVFVHVPMPRMRGRPIRRADRRPDMAQMRAALVRAARMLVILSRRRQRTGGT